MTELAKLLKKRGKPPGPAPKDWLLAARLPVRGGALFVGDPYYDPADAYVATLPIGTYRIDARLRDLDGEWYPARIRAILEGSDKLKLGKQIGETCTDLAVLAFYDMKTAASAIAGDHDRYMKQVTKKSFSGCGVVQLKLKKPLSIAYVETGFDCGAMVYELRSGRQRVGVEVEIDFAELEADVEEVSVDQPGFVRRPPPLGQGFQAGTCIHCQGSGDCFCVRNGGKKSPQCPRCGGSGKCHVCDGRGKSSG